MYFVLLSRSGEECIVALNDQWYLPYGEEEWAGRVKSHVNSDNFEAYSQVKGRAPEGRRRKGKGKRGVDGECILRRLRPHSGRRNRVGKREGKKIRISSGRKDHYIGFDNTYDQPIVSVPFLAGRHSLPSYC